MINETVLRRLHEKTLDEWMDIFLRSDDIGVEPFRTPTEALDHPQMVHNGHVLELTDPGLGKTRQVGPLVRMSKTPSAPREAAPRPGDTSTSRRSVPGPHGGHGAVWTVGGGGARRSAQRGHRRSSWPGFTRPRSARLCSPTWAPG